MKKMIGATPLSVRFYTNLLGTLTPADMERGHVVGFPGRVCASLTMIDRVW